MVSKTTLSAAIAATFWSPAVSDELRPIKYKVTVMEQVRYEITVKAVETVAEKCIGACA
jgi:hypothetical protein